MDSRSIDIGVLPAIPFCLLVMEIILAIYSPITRATTHTDLCFCHLKVALMLILEPPGILLDQ
ncbi:hypothetical protein ACMD2_03189 [Ananas comosus]|uniref:Uncharacterized protein n=1 Tax=Ananas comosus TaxID=4615 RepID=A0A199VL44_ANACO|nr:hypothetical protein ACMD2_03189 [Ananas comosus]